MVQSDLFPQIVRAGSFPSPCRTYVGFREALFKEFEPLFQCFWANVVGGSLVPVIVRGNKTSMRIRSRMRLPALHNTPIIWLRRGGPRTMVRNRPRVSCLEDRGWC